MDMKTSPLSTLSDPGLLKTQGLINGEWVGAADAQAHFAVTDPATGLELVKVANLGPVECAAALSAAERAWPAWRAKTAKERSAILMKWFALLHQHADDLARILTAEQGKPLAEARGEVIYVASFSSSGLPKKPSASTARPSPPPTTTSATSSSSSRSACARPSRRGTFRSR